jgi:uncharacterized protein (DUF983 family)
MTDAAKIGYRRVMCPLCGQTWIMAAMYLDTVVACMHCGRDTTPIEVSNPFKQDEDKR